MRRWLGAVAVGLACCAGRAHAQQAEPAPWSRPSYLYSGLSSVYVSNIDHTPAGSASYGALADVGAQYSGRFGHLSVEFEYEGVFRRYTGTDIWNHPGHVGQGSLAWRVTPRMVVRLDGEVSLNGSAEDLVIRNEYSVSPQLEWRFSRTSRLALYGEYLLKRYPDPLVGRDAVDPRIGLRFRQIRAEGMSWSISGRYEQNRADSSRYHYSSWTGGVDAANPIGAEGRIWSSVRYRIRHYDSRLISVGASQALRRDQNAVATLGWEHLVWRSWSIVLSYRFEANTSNDERRKFEDHRVTVSMRRWW